MFSAIIIAAVIIGSMAVCGSVLQLIGQLHIAKAQEAVAAALAGRNQIEANKTRDGLRGFRDEILGAAEERANEMDDQLVRVIAGKETWRHERGAEGRLRDDATVVVRSDEQDAAYRDRQEPRPERGGRYNDVSSTTVANFRVLQTLGYDLKVADKQYHPMPFESEGVTHPGQIAADDQLQHKLWEDMLHWMRHTQPAASPDDRPYHQHPTFAGYTWYDAFRAMFAKTFGFGLFADLLDQFPGLSNSPQYKQFLAEQRGGHAAQ